MKSQKRGEESILSTDWTISTMLLADRSVSILETVSEYLKEQKQLSFRQAGKLLKRDERTIWTCYHRALKKRAFQKQYLKPLSSFEIPLRIFQNRLFSSLEVLVVYLKEEKGLSYHEIGQLLSRDERTIWTCYHRSQKKMEKENE